MPEHLMTRKIGSSCIDLPSGYEPVYSQHAASARLPRVLEVSHGWPRFASEAPRLAFVQGCREVWQAAKDSGPPKQEKPATGRSRAGQGRSFWDLLVNAIRALPLVGFEGLDGVSSLPQRAPALIRARVVC